MKGGGKWGGKNIFHIVEFFSVGYRGLWGGLGDCGGVLMVRDR